VRSALQSLPCVEKGSIDVDVQEHKARFTVKKGEKCDLEEVKERIKKAGDEIGKDFKVTEVETPKTK
jgi:hypothetical protein